MKPIENFELTLKNLHEKRKKMLEEIEPAIRNFAKAIERLNNICPGGGGTGNVRCRDASGSMNEEDSPDCG